MAETVACHSCGKEFQKDDAGLVGVVLGSCKGPWFYCQECVPRVIAGPKRGHLEIERLALDNKELLRERDSAIAANRPLAEAWYEARNERDRLRAALGGLLRHCDVTPEGETNFEQAVLTARRVLEGRSADEPLEVYACGVCGEEHIKPSRRGIRNE